MPRSRLPADPETKLYFREEQRFRQPWLWLLLLLSSGLVVGIFGYGLIVQLILGRPWGNQPMSDTGLVIVTLVSAALMLGMLWLLWSLSLAVEVRTDAVLIHLRPLKKRSLTYAEIERAEPCVYRPIRDYGGWGIRKGRAGWAYNVSGNRGVRLHLVDGRQLLIGSQREKALAAAIEKRRTS